MKRLILVVALVATSAHAEFLDGNELLDRMRSTEPVRRGVAIGYVLGVHDTMARVNHCTPSNVTSGQLRDIVQNYITNTPARRHESADVLVMDALKIGFPCANNRSRGGTNL
jgi:hypothetical protein